jgi:hypothetical protein
LHSAASEFFAERLCLLIERAASWPDAPPPGASADLATYSGERARVCVSASLLQPHKVTECPATVHARRRTRHATTVLPDVLLLLNQLLPLSRLSGGEEEQLRISPKVGIRCLFHLPICWSAHANSDSTPREFNKSAVQQTEDADGSECLVSLLRVRSARGPLSTGFVFLSSVFQCTQITQTLAVFAVSRRQEERAKKAGSLRS